MDSGSSTFKHCVASENHAEDEKKATTIRVTSGAKIANSKLGEGQQEFCVFKKKSSIFMTIVQVCSRKMRAAGDRQQQEAVSIKFL